jgi:F-type H+-transporting ATPase subunit a
MNITAVSSVNTTLLSSLAVTPALSIEGPQVLWQFELFGMTHYLTSSVAGQWIVMAILAVVFAVLGRNLKVKPESRRQLIAEMLVKTFDGMVKESMGPRYFAYGPYIGALFMYSMALSFSTFLGLFPPTGDISVIGAWGLLTFMLVQVNRFKSGGLLGGLKSFTKPIFFMTPSNLISEISNPVSQSFRHYGNILAGVVIGSLVFWALEVFIVVPLIAPIPLSLYFDLFLGLLQAFVFASLTMVYIAMAEVEPPEPKKV